MQEEQPSDNRELNQESRRAYLIYFGLGGHGVELELISAKGTRSHGHISGYDSPESFERALSAGEKAGYPPLSRVPVIDKRIILKVHPEYSFKSPLVDPSLADGEIDRIGVESAKSMLPGLSGGFDTLASAAISHADSGRKEPGPLDSVSLNDYLTWWRSRGARYGRMNLAGTRIEWEDEHASR